MRKLVLSLLALLPLVALPPTRAEEPLRLTYRTYALGLPIADAAATLGLGAWSYQIDLSFRTIGLASALLQWRQANAVHGSWDDHRPLPRHYAGHGNWRGEERVTLIDYAEGHPTIRHLLPPLEDDREIVPPELRANTTDSLSAMAALIRAVGRTGRCEASQRTYDGRRAVESTARSVGPEILAETGRSSFSGRALRCDFVSRMVAGFRADDDSKTGYRPLLGSVWLAEALPNHPAIPVRVKIESRWFGDTTSYLTSATRSGL